MEAIKESDLAIEMNPNNSKAKEQKISACVMESVRLIQSNQHSKAVSYLRNALVIDENHPQAADIKHLLEELEEISRLERYKLEIAKQNSEEQAKQSSLKSEISKHNKSNLEVDSFSQEQWDFADDFVTRDAYMQVSADQRYEERSLIGINNFNTQHMDIASST